MTKQLSCFIHIFPSPQPFYTKGHAMHPAKKPLHKKSKVLLILTLSLLYASAVTTCTVMTANSLNNPSKAKYTLSKHKSGAIHTEPYSPGPALYKIECISQSEKDCEQTTIPEPSSLMLLGLGIFLLRKARKQGK